MWLLNLDSKFASLNLLFGAVNLSEIAYCDKYSCFGYGIGFDTCGLSDGSSFGKNARLFGVDNNFSVHADNRTKVILVLGKGLIDGLDDTILTAEAE